MGILSSNVIERFSARFNGIQNGKHVFRDVICKGVVEKEHDQIIHVLYYKDLFNPSFGHFFSGLFGKKKVSWQRLFVDYDKKDKEGRFKYPFNIQYRHDCINKKYVEFRDYKVWVDGTTFDINNVNNSSLIIENNNIARRNNMLKEQLADSRRDNFSTTTDVKFKKRIEDEATSNQKIRSKYGFNSGWDNRLD